jgi:hypothetical protein
MMINKKIMNKKVVSVTLCAALMASLCGCQKNPEKSVVVHKNMDNLIEEAQDTENGIVDVAEAVKNYDSYKTELSSDSLNVDVNVDAKVDIPDVDKLAVYRVSQKQVSQDMVDKLIDIFMPGETLYDGAALSVQTRGELEQEIQELQEEIDEVDTYENMSDEDKQVYIDDRQMILDGYQEEYENAPETLDLENYISDGQLRTVDEWLNMGGFAGYYNWQKTLNEDGEVLYAFSGDKYIYIQNNERYGNCIRYMKSSDVAMSDISSVCVGSTDLESVNNDDKNYEGSALIWPADEAVPETVYQYYEDSERNLEDLTQTPVTISEEDAKAMADEFLEKMGIEDFELSESGKYSEMKYGDSLGYQTCYILQYMRVLDGTMVTFDSISKHEEGWVGDSYVKYDWPIESIEFRINDDGIVGFDYNAPLEVTETVVDKSAIKSFDEIKDTFEEMILIANAAEYDNDETVKLDINQVVLGYARISEEDSYDTGLMVPVWDFKGSKIDCFESNDNVIENYVLYGGLMTINAIDGTVIDREIGY